MADYTQITDFSAKDALTTGDPEKIILGADLDAELSAISTAVASKYDSSDIASEAQAEALALDTVLITPLQLGNVLQDNAGMAYDIQQLAAFGADRMLFWDHSDLAVEALAPGTGLSISGNDLNVDVNHDALAGFVSDEHVAHSGVNLTAGAGLTGGGTIAASRSFAVGAGSGITVNADNVAITDQAASTTRGITITSGVINIDITSLTQIEGNALSATDEVLIQDGSVLKAMRYQDAGLIVNAAISTVYTFVDADMNQVHQLSGATDREWDLDTGVGVQGNFLILIQTGTGQIDLGAGTATINNASSHDGSRTQDSVIFLICTAANTWTLYGDTATVA